MTCSQHVTAVKKGGSRVARCLEIQQGCLKERAREEGHLPDLLWVEL